MSNCRIIRSIPTGLIAARHGDMLARLPINAREECCVRASLHAA